MLPVIIPVVVGGTAAIAWYRAKHKPKGLTPKQQRIYESALRTLKDPAKLRTLADGFCKAGAMKECEHLRQRAALAELPKPEKQKLRKAFKVGMKYTDPTKVAKLANAFQTKGADGAASALRKREKALRAAS